MGPSGKDDQDGGSWGLGEVAVRGSGYPIVKSGATPGEFGKTEE